MSWFVEVYEVAEEVREKHLEDIYQYLAEGYSKHDCVDIAEEVRSKLEALGLEARVVRVHPDIKHWAVFVTDGSDNYFVDVVPELSGYFDDVLFEPFVLVSPSECEIIRLYLRGEEDACREV